MTATPVVPETFDLANRNPLLMWKFWKCINLSSYLLFVNFIGKMIFFFFWLEEVLSTSSPFTCLLHSYHLHPSLPCTAWMFYLTSQWNEKFFLISLVYRLLYYFSLSVTLGIDKKSNGHLSLLRVAELYGNLPSNPSSYQQAVLCCHQVTRMTLLGFQHITNLSYKDAECKASVYRDFLVN